MARYPRAVRSARIKCVSCNAPVVETIDGEYACVDCGGSPISSTESAGKDGSTDPVGSDGSTGQRPVVESVGEDGRDVAADGDD